MTTAQLNAALFYRWIGVSYTSHSRVSTESRHNDYDTFDGWEDRHNYLPITARVQAMRWRNPRSEHGGADKKA